MQAIGIFIVAGVIFFLCWCVDKTFSKLFRSKAQQRSGLAVRANKRYGVFGVILSVLGILGIIAGAREGAEKVLTWAGIIVMLMGVAFATYYLSFGIFYDADSFLICRFGKKGREYTFRDIQMQKLYVVTGGNIIIELALRDGSNVQLQSNMQGVYPFMDVAFAGWCRQSGTTPEQCDFYDPSKSWWFPHEQETQ